MVARLSRLVRHPLRVSSSRPHIGDPERRARLARRHGVAEPHRFADVETAAASMTALHATEPATVYLSAFARVDGLVPADVDRALYERRSLVKQLAMRRTLFVLPASLLPAAWGSAAARVAEQERRRRAKYIAAAGLADDGAAWLERACAAVLAQLEETDGLTTRQIRMRVPEVQGRVSMSPGTRWGGDVQVAPWVLTLLGARGRVVRGHNEGDWRTSRPRWWLMSRWLATVPEPASPEAGYAQLVQGWLRTFGPGTTDDISWWLGSTKTDVRHALGELGAVEVSLDGADSGWVLPDDVEPEPDVEPWAALLPVLDPTTMGWKARDFYLDPEHRPYLFDSNGNAGTTAWWNGRVVGCWVQDPDGTVHVILREDVGECARAALDVEAARLTNWLDGTRITNVYTSLQMKSAKLT
jgi:Winged helix DNA-binding domain